MDLKNLELPYSKEAEMNVLGAILLDEKALLKTLEVLKEDDFYFEEHRKIYRAVKELFEQVKHVDHLTLSEYLEKKGILDEIGGLSYLAQLVENTIAPSLIENHLKIVIEKSLYRKIIKAAENIIKTAYTQNLDADDLLDRAENEIMSIKEERLRRGFVKVGDIVEDVYNYLKEIATAQRHLTGLPSGFPELDEMTAGFQKGDLIIIASRPSMGKTSFILNILRYLAVEEKVPVAIFSLEMSKEQLLQRLLCMEAEIDGHKARKGQLEEIELRRVRYAVEKLKNAPIFIDDSNPLPLIELKAKARRIWLEGKIELIAIDYLQMIQSPRRDTKTQEIALITASLKSLARELNIPVIALSQLSREVERREDKRPRLADLRESGAIEQDADVVMFLFRPSFYDPEADDLLTEIDIAKQRNGPTGTISLAFYRNTGRFKPYSMSEIPQQQERTIYDDFEDNF